METIDIAIAELTFSSERHGSFFQATPQRFVPPFATGRFQDLAGGSISFSLMDDVDDGKRDWESDEESNPAPPADK